MTGSTTAMLRVVTAVADGPDYNAGVFVRSDARPTFDSFHSRAVGSGPGILVRSGASPLVRNPRVEAASQAIKTGPANDVEARAAHSQLIGGISGGGFSCIGAYNKSMSPLTATCG